MDKSRTQILIGEENLSRLTCLHAVVVGTGGVGSATAIMLARAGVEKMTIVDFDEVAPSNINRQMIAFQSTIGRKKVEVLREILLDINQKISVTAIDERLTKENVASLTAGADIVIDAIDSVTDKVELICHCKQNNIKIISAMGAGNRYVLPNFEVCDIFKTHDDGLAKVIRKKLRERGVDKLKVVTTNSPAQCQPQGEVGSISYLPVMCGCTIAGEVINMIIKGEL